MLPVDINLWHVRNKDDGMVPFLTALAGKPARRVWNAITALFGGKEIVGRRRGLVPGRRWMSSRSLIASLPGGLARMDSHVFTGNGSPARRRPLLHISLRSRLPVSGGIV